MFLGSYLKLSAPNYYLGIIKQALNIGANCFMFYTGSPQNTIRLPTELLKIKEARKIIQTSNIDESKIVIHAPFIINLASSNFSIYSLAIKFLLLELKRTKDFNVKQIVVHPGCYVNTNEKIGIKNIIKNLNLVLNKDKTDVKILLETMSGKGTEIGYKFEHLKEIISGINKKYQDRIGVCLDICHINDAGYNVHNVKSIIEHFDKVIGLKKLLAIHVSDSLNKIGSHKDRHANIGYGTIGFDTIYKYVNHERLKDIPKILETPTLNGKYIYDKEITMLKKQIKNL